MILQMMLDDAVVDAARCCGLDQGTASLSRDSEAAIPILVRDLLHSESEYPFWHDDQKICFVQLFTCSIVELFHCSNVKVITNRGMITFPLLPSSSVQLLNVTSTAKRDFSSSVSCCVKWFDGLEAQGKNKQTSKQTTKLVLSRFVFGSLSNKKKKKTCEKRLNPHTVGWWRRRIPEEESCLWRGKRSTEKVWSRLISNQPGWLIKWVHKTPRRNRLHKLTTTLTA